MKSHNNVTSNGIDVRPRTRALFFVLGFGAVGLIVTALLMWLVPSSQEILNTRHTNILTNVLDILAVPALMFFLVVIAYAVNELYKIYREINDPNNYRRNRNRTNRAH